MKIYRVTDKEFAKYGKVYNLDTKEIVEVAEKIAMPNADEGAIYHASQPEFECLAIKDVIEKECFGQMPTQLGYCWGYNNQMNALEWHKCSEINIAIEDIILILGAQQDVEADNRYDSAKVEAFRLNKGEAIEMYATTLHYCPIQTKDSGFGCVVGLLKGTNTELNGKPEDELMFAKNKWLIAHVDNEELKADGAFCGIYGENYKF